MNPGYGVWATSAIASARGSQPRTSDQDHIKSPRSKTRESFTEDGRVPRNSRSRDESCAELRIWRWHLAEHLQGAKRSRTRRLRRGGRSLGCRRRSSRWRRSRGKRSSFLEGGETLAGLKTHGRRVDAMPLLIRARVRGPSKDMADMTAASAQGRVRRSIC